MEKNHLKSKRGIRRPFGYATLVMSVIVLVLVSLIGLSLAGSNISIARTIRNSVEHTVALANAESRVDELFAWALANNFTVDASWAACGGVLTSPNFNDISGYVAWDCISAETLTGRTELSRVFVATPQNTLTRNVIFHVIALGDSPLDGTTKAVVKDGFYYYNASQGGDLTKTPPIVSVGNVPLNGSFSIVANPNAGGPGVAVSIWSRNSISFGASASFATCHIEAYEADTSTIKKCPSTPEAGAITTKDLGQQYDIVASDTDFPSDGELFKFILGIDKDDDDEIDRLKQRLGANLVSSCGNTLSGKSGLVWVENMGATCSIPSMGCGGKPVVLVSDSNAINIAGDFCGLILSINSNAGDTIDANGNNFVRGAMISDNPTSMGTIMNGTFAVVWDPDVLSQLAGIISDATGSRRVVKIPGAWADYL